MPSDNNGCLRDDSTAAHGLYAGPDATGRKTITGTIYPTPWPGYIRALSQNPANQRAEQTAAMVMPLACRLAQQGTHAADFRRQATKLLA